MSKIKFLGWDKRPRTMLRYIKPGDIFALALTSDLYAVGRILSKVSVGHVAEIFMPFRDTPTADALALQKVERAMSPVILDSYSLFDRKSEGDWRIVAHDEQFDPKIIGNIYFAYGAPGSRRKIDHLENITPCSQVEADSLPTYSPEGELRIRRELLSKAPWQNQD